MKIFVRSPSLDEIRTAAAAGFADGVVLSLADFPAGHTSADLHDRLVDVAHEFALPVCVPVSVVAGADIYRDARELGKVSDQVIVQIPMLEDAIAPIRRLRADGIRVCATYIYTGAQAFLAAKAGAVMVTVPVQDLEAQGQRGAAVVAEIRDVIDASDVECDLDVASPRDAVQFTACILAGADTVSLDPATLRSLLVHPLTDRGVDRFLSDVSRHSRGRGAV